MSDASGSVIKTDHGHRVPTSIKLKDKTVNKRYSACNGMHACITECGQVYSLILTKTVNTLERFPQGAELAERYRDRDLPKPTFFADRCCGDNQWLRAFGGVSVKMDTAHMLARCADALGTFNRARHSSVMRALAKAFTVDGIGMADHRPGMEIYDDFTAILKKVEISEQEAGIPKQSRTVCERTWKLHAEEKKHFISCIGPLGDKEEDFIQEDRFGRRILKIYRGMRGILQAYERHLS